MFSIIQQRNLATTNEFNLTFGLYLAIKSKISIHYFTFVILSIINLFIFKLAIAFQTSLFPVYSIYGMEGEACITDSALCVWVDKALKDTLFSVLPCKYTLSASFHLGK